MTPKLWILLGKGAGGNAQMRMLADALGWPYEAKHLVYNRLEKTANLLLGATGWSLDRKRSDPFEPPWPDLVIGASRRSAPIARWIRRRSGGRTRLVHLLHTQAPLHHFDLIVTTPQYCLPERANVLHNTGPLNCPRPEDLAAAAAAWSARLESLPAPRIALLVGGNSSSYVLGDADAARLGREASALARSLGGSLLVSTSPRTPPAAAQALGAAIDCPVHFYRWRANDPENPYRAFLGLADRFVVTVDTASQLVEACATGRPVHLFEWPVRARARFDIKAARRRWSEWSRGAGRGSVPARLYDALVYTGLLKPPRDFAAFHRALRERGLLLPWGETRSTRPPLPLDDLERAVARVRALFEAANAGAETVTRC